MRTAYPLIIFRKENGEKYHTVYIPDLDSYTQGEDYFECIEMARDLIGITWIEYQESNLKFPKPLEVENFEYYDDLIPEMNSLVDIDFQEYKRKLENKTIKKTLSIPYKLNELGEKQGLNFSKVLQEALKEVLGV